MSGLVEVLLPLLDRLPQVLADDRAREGLLRAAGLLPTDLTAGPVGLELRLAGPPVVDLFAVAVPGTDPFRALIAALRGPGWRDGARAADLAAALERWARRKGALPAVARYLLVEADAPDPGAEVAVPSIFLAPRNPHDVWREAMAPNAFQARPEVTTMAAAELSGVWPDPTTAAALAQLSAALPETADVFAVGSMISRDSGASLRVAVRRLTSAQTFEVLSGLGRVRQAEVLSSWAERTSAVDQAVAFEIGPGAEDRVGLELSPHHDWKKALPTGWPELLEEVVAAGLALPERAAVVPGLIDSEADPLWGLAHVKIAADDDGQLPGSKLYVGLLHDGAR